MSSMSEENLANIIARSMPGSRLLYTARHEAAKAVLAHVQPIIDAAVAAEREDAEYELARLSIDHMRLHRLLGSHADGHRCTCTMTAPADYIAMTPDEWEQDPWCPTHPDVDVIKAEYDAERARADAAEAALAAERARREEVWQFVGPVTYSDADPGQCTCDTDFCTTEADDGCALCKRLDPEASCPAWADAIREHLPNVDFGVERIGPATGERMTPTDSNVLRGEG